MRPDFYCALEQSYNDNLWSVSGINDSPSRTVDRACVIANYRFIGLRNDYIRDRRI